MDIEVSPSGKEKDPGANEDASSMPDGGRFAVSVESATEEEAPLAGRIRTRLYDGDGGMSLAMHPFRFYRGKFYGSMVFCGGRPQGRLSNTASENEPADADKVKAWLEALLESRSAAGSLETAREEVAEEASKVLCVDGCWHYEIGEPRYEVATFGPGRNDGGTLVFVQTGYDDRIASSSYFNANDYEAAKEKALSLAKQRGDTESVEYILSKAESDELERIEVLAPWAFTCDPATEHTGYDPFVASLLEAFGIPLGVVVVRAVRVG